MGSLENPECRYCCRRMTQGKSVGPIKQKKSRGLNQCTSQSSNTKKKREKQRMRFSTQLQIHPPKVGSCPTGLMFLWVPPCMDFRCPESLDLHCQKASVRLLSFRHFQKGRWSCCPACWRIHFGLKISFLLPSLHRHGRTAVPELVIPQYSPRAKPHSVRAI